MRVARAVAVVVLLGAINAVCWNLSTASAVVPGAVVPYGAADYRYMQVSSGGGPASFSDAGFNDSAFGVGDAPFGVSTGFGCHLVPATGWAPNTDLLVRRVVSLPAGTNGVMIRMAVDNDVELFWNGTSVGAFKHDGCASRGSLQVPIPDGLITAGNNVLAARAIDRGGETFFDLEVTANLPPDCASVTTDTTTLWPPNHDLHTVTVQGGTDPEGDAVTLAVASVTQDEPLDDSGDGTTMADADRGDSPSDTVRLRAERSGNGDGRVYRLNVVVTDSDGASCSTTLSVGVPHDKHRAPVDTVAVSVDSFGPASTGLVANAESPIPSLDGQGGSNEAPAPNAPPVRPDPPVTAGAARTPVELVAATPSEPSSTVASSSGVTLPDAPAAGLPEPTSVSVPTSPADKEKPQKSGQQNRQNPPAPSARPKR